MRTFLTTAVLAATMAFAAPAFADTMSATYGNTVTVTTAEGVQIHYHMNEDGSYDMITPEGTISGTWAIDGDNICLTPAGGEAGCSPLDNDRGVGDSWDATAADGSAITLSITEGR